MKPQRSFYARVSAFLEELQLPEKETKTIEHELVRVALQIQDGVGSTKLRQYCYSLNRLPEFTYFKDQYLDVSYYIHRELWLAVFHQVKDGTVPNTEPLMGDASYCISLLDAKDTAKVKKQVINESLSVDSLELDETWTTGKKKRRNFMQYVKSKTSTLNYLSRYDPGLSQDDFAQDLACEALRTFNTYPRSKCQTQDDSPIRVRVEKYIERSLNNKVLSLKGYYACENRRRIVSTIPHLYNEQSQYKKLFRAAQKEEKAALDAGDLTRRWLAKQLEVFGVEVADQDEKTLKGALRKKKNELILQKKTEVECLTASISATPSNTRIKRWLVSLLSREIAKLEDQRLNVGTIYQEMTGEASRSIEYLDNIMDAKKRIKEKGSDYYSVVRPLVRPDANDDQTIDIEDVDEAQQQQYVRAEGHIVVEGICREVEDPRIANFIKIVCGEVDQSFEQWADGRKLNLQNFPTLVMSAKKYLKISDQDLRRNTTIRKYRKALFESVADSSL